MKKPFFPFLISVLTTLDRVSEATAGWLTSTALSLSFLLLRICDMLAENSFSTPLLRRHGGLIRIEPKSEFIAADKDKVWKQSSWGKHQRGAFVLIIYIIFRVAIGKRER